MEKIVKWKKYISRAHSLYKADIYFGGLRQVLMKFFDFKLNNIMIYGKGIDCAVYLGEEDFKEYSNLVKEHFLNSIKIGKDPFYILKKVQEGLLNSSERINFMGSSSQDMVSAYTDFIDRVKDYQIMIWFPALCEEELFPYAKQRLEKLTSSSGAWEVINRPIEPSLLQREFIDLLRLKIDYSEDKLKEHYQKYCWLAVRFVEDEPYDLEYFRKRMDEIQNPNEKLKLILIESEQKMKQFYDLLNLLNPSEEDRELFDCINRLSLLRQTRDEGRRLAYYNAKPFFAKLLKVLNTDYGTLLRCLDKDVLECLRKEVSLSPVESDPSYVYMIKGDRFHFIRDNLSEVLEKEGITDSGDINKSEISGVIASSGKITGRARIIHLNSWREDILRVQKGDILFAVSTKPDYLVAMEKAAAFVTDEGGVTCHAAIVAREMNKPCIIATKNASKVFKDGDLIEVDADKGIVRKF